ncbi:MAG: hypothetical protein H5U12_11055 [Hoeflea sp.]|nr:hypothetical protein [Hoeflea sp.]
MLQVFDTSTATLIERVRAGFGRRAVGIAAALTLEALILLLLLSLGASNFSPRRPATTLTTFEASSSPDAPADEPEPTEEPAQPSAADSPAVDAVPDKVDEAVVAVEPVPSAPATISLPREQAAPVIVAPPSRPEPRPTPDRDLGSVQGPVLGPSDRAATADTQLVGTAPNGEPLYAAAWYRRPYPDELAGFLSTASGPGWALIACRTVEEFRVEDCVALEESPRGSNIARSVLAAAYQFRVRPPRVGGRSLVGTWVRIRIDYNLRPG